jgi:alanine racemase
MNRHEERIRPVWAEINLDAIRHNVGEVRRLIGPEAAIMAVVKAEAYGHGGFEVARAALEAGANWLGVALLEEGIALRRAGITAPLLVLTPLTAGQATAVVAHTLSVAICDMAAVRALSTAVSQVDRKIAVHVKVDTGMGRVGLPPSETAAFLEKLTAMPGIEVEGLFSHLATADEPDKTYAREQIARFERLVQELIATELLPRYVHIANSAAVIDLPEAHYNLVRPGIMLYGLPPSAEVGLERVQLKPALTLKTRVIFVKRVPAGTGISYGQKYHTTQAATIATIPIGYADGWSRRLSGRVSALIHGKRYPLVGTICMDQCMIDLGDDPVAIGDEVVLLGAQGSELITADEIAAVLGTINYEATCMISDRVPRIYNGQ